MKINQESILGMEPLYDNLFEVVFPIYNELLSQSITYLSPGSMSFSLNIKDNRILPLIEILDLTSEKRDIIVNMVDKKGNIYMKTIYKNCKFTYSLEQLLYHSYAALSIKEFHIGFSHESIEILDGNSKELSYPFSTY